MSIVLQREEVVYKVFNNNIILVNSESKEKILFAKGIGFAKKPGGIIKIGTSVDKIFTIENNENRINFNNMIETVESDFFAVCEEGIYEISKEINKELNENIHIALIDHLHFAVKRMKSKEIIKNPFLVEIQTLYSKEFSLAKMVGNRVADYCNVEIPDGEIAFIALHIHSAINDGNISNSLKSNYLGSKIVEHVETRLNIKIDKKSLDYARFLTHIKFAVQRILENRVVDNQLGEMIKNTYNESYLIAVEVAEIIGQELKVKVKEDEVTFLTIHIERFRMSLKY